MSGTSADGIDVALIRTDGQETLESLGGITVPYDSAFQRALIEMASGDAPVEELKASSLALQRQLTALHAAAVQQCCSALHVSLAQVDVVGFHGHTMRHLPQQGLTWQMGDGQALADALGCTVVYDFRQADMAAGGQGAPLAPLYHRAVVGNRAGPQLVLNLGGVANLTWIGDGDQIMAGDTGPGCGLLDAWVQAHCEQSFDRDGTIALRGCVDKAFVLQAMERTPYFSRPLPKSADRFEFDEMDMSRFSLEDGAATLCAITVEAIVRCVHQLPAPPVECWVSGGGRHHPLIMQLLGERLPQVKPISACGCNEDLLEAECFAWLAVRRLRNLPTSLPETTGARVPVSGGVVVKPRR
jgi:anhydro-N-acetylmuramic acid kinase